MTEIARGLDPLAEAANELPEHYIETTTALVQSELRSLKHGDAFAVLDEYGDIGVSGPCAEGVYFNDTRYLSCLKLLIEGIRPLLLSSVVQDDNVALSVDLANPDVAEDGFIVLPRDTIFIERTKFLWRGVLYERIGFRNFDGHRRQFCITVCYDADFRDLFEIRGSRRMQRGRVTHALGKAGPEFHYDGLDGVKRTTRLTFWPEPTTADHKSATFLIDIGPYERSSMFVSIVCSDRCAPQLTHFSLAFRDRRRAIRAKTAAIATIDSSNGLFNEVCRRATSDLYMLVSRTPHGLYPYAGIPWYSTPFGRDGIITAMMLLWADPAVARGVLSFLSATQADRFDPAADAQPGKILHETRNGEMARLGEVPFRRYYGAVDATPLFVMLAGMYFERTGDRDTIAKIWPNILAALRWIDEFGDRDGDGFVEYLRETENGLANQGWKDSHDSIFHADGSLAEGPIALCEVQGYVYAAKSAAGRLARLMGDDDAGAKYDAAAQALKTAFDKAFWCEDLGCYALALDGRKKPCRVRASNSGHALFAGIALPERAKTVAKTLLGRSFFSGWGIRTVASGEMRYNPISYHNGSIWPHDNAMIALGFSRYGLGSEAIQIFSAMFEAAAHQDLRRLPELFCGFSRKPHRGPTSYPVACAPQAWAAASIFALLQATLGMELCSQSHSIRFVNPLMPQFLDSVTLTRLTVGESHVRLKLQRHGDDVTLNLLERKGAATVMLVK
ncbi:amylo-alpha-1,6-glucosidase [Methylocella silvestris]|uniref:Amylo-alpha-1,6-glucosidase n=1 Tax=Methylocella silvestris TaxID=199596 RepID=A0A2J7TG62_METSI|nr:glycogen debranching N-terminal domain-containing protein [Methylocella silvestris]PNG25764.1 amylo-alpha-1,6-glucosidase [Methylocella silvestris]